MYQIIQKRKIWLSISSGLLAVSLAALLIWGLNFGIDFTGGSLLEVRFEDNRPSVSEVNSAMGDLALGSLIVQPVDEDGMILRFQSIDEGLHQEVLNRLNALALGNTEDEVGDVNEDNQVGEDENIEDTEEAESEDVLIKKVEELRFDSVGPTIGRELKEKSFTAIIIVLLVIVLYIAWAFRRVSKPVESWKYGITAIIALFHDIIITLGAFSILGYYFGIEVNIAFVAAILTVLGYSVNDTIVVFDRIRENLPKSDYDFEETVNLSVNQTISRSINTSLTTLVVLVAILIFGGESIRDFVLALSIGVFVGTYSSIFLASPVLVLWELRNRK